MDVRKNYRNLTAVERDHFVKALFKLKSIGVVDQFAKIHEEYFFKGIHRCSHFLPWHREMLFRFGLELKRIYPEITIPYWDSTTDTRPTDPLWADNFLGPFNTAWKLGRALGSARLPTPQRVEEIQGLGTYDKFWPELESDIHNPPHNWVEGVMGTTASPGDPVFYLHHCWIDMLWARWQLAHPKAPFVSSGPGYGLNDPLAYWKDRKPADVLDHHALGYTYDFEAWQPLPGAATDIGVGRDGKAWVVGNTPAVGGGGYDIYRWDGNTWIPVAGGAVRIAVSPEGTPWVVNDHGTIFRWDDNDKTWQSRPEAAVDIGVGSKDAAWIIGTDPTDGGYGIYRWNGGKWELVEGGAVRIAVSPDGIPWVVNNRGEIYRRDGNTWQRQPGAAIDIGVGSNGAAWVIGTNKTSGGYGIYWLDGNMWIPVLRGALSIAVSPEGIPWVVDDAHNVYRRP